MDTNDGSSGSPVILIENCKVIGIHKKKIEESDNKKGTFISKLIEKSNESPKIINLKIINDVNEINENSPKDCEEKNILILKYNLDIEDPIMLFSKNFFYKNKDKLIVNINENEKDYKLEKNSIKKDIMLFSKNFFYKNKDKFFNICKIYQFRYK